MEQQYQVAGYVKLAKLWEKKREKAVVYHKGYYERKYKNNPQMKLIDVYIDITGSKHIYQRREMIRLLRDCKTGKINCIATQTRGYLAANLEEFCYMYAYISEFNNEILLVTEDDQYQINTIDNHENQKDELTRMAKSFIKTAPQEYVLWKEKVEKMIAKIGNNEGGASDG